MILLFLQSVGMAKEAEVKPFIISIKMKTFSHNGSKMSLVHPNKEHKKKGKIEKAIPSLFFPPNICPVPGQSNAIIKHAIFLFADEAI